MHEYSVRLKGRRREEQKQYELARWIAWQVLSPHYGRGRKPQTPMKFCKFPWEIDPNCPTTEAEARQVLEASRVTAEEAETLNRLFADYNEKNMKKRTGNDGKDR